MGVSGWTAGSRRGTLANDALLAALMFGAETLLIVLAPRELRPRSLPIALVFAAVEMVPVLLRHRWVWLAVGMTTAHSVAALIDLPDTKHSGFAIVVVTYTAASSLRWWPSVAATMAMWLPSLAVAFTIRSAWASVGLGTGYYLAFCVLSALVCFFVGRTVWNRRAFVAALEDRARTAEATQRALTAQAVTEERQRIARELHDVVAHHISVMGVLATGSRRALTRDPAAADEALATIEQTGRTVLKEMRRLLDVLRADGSERDGDGLVPQPGVMDLDALAEQVGEAGLPITLTVDDRLQGLDPGMALAVYRIVQEALTNVIKHARATSAEVRLALIDSCLELEVADNGQGPPPGRRLGGHGLVGMRERAALYGGALRVGPRPGGGFRVCARIPVDPHHAAVAGPDGEATRASLAALAASQPTPTKETAS